MSDNLAFSFIPLPHTVAKPRDTGLTAVIDKGLGLQSLQELIQLAGNYIDIVKIGFGTSRLYSRELLKQKINLLNEANILACPGGTLFEITRTHQQVDAFWHECKALGFRSIEISDGVLPLALESKCQLIKQGRAHGFIVLAEVGRKQPDLDQLLTIEQKASETQALLQAGAWKVILEARESGNVGLFDSEGDIKTQEIQDLVSLLDINDVLFEAPQKKQQVWLLQHLSMQINFANIAPTDVLALASLRQRLRADTMEV
ncbi:MAG: phosphosulfolactate synthase [Legionellales bacterium]|nr:phosphosulfolactate synthase [Legionellales bacterium]